MSRTACRIRKSSLPIQKVHLHLNPDNLRIIPQDVHHGTSPLTESRKISAAASAGDSRMSSVDVGTETRIGVGTEVGINVGTETGEKTGRAGKGPQQKMEGPSCMINLTLGSLALGQP